MSDSAGTSATTSSLWLTRTIPPGRTVPTTDASISQRVATSSTSGTLSAATKAIIRSCDSDVRSSGRSSRSHARGRGRGRGRARRRLGQQARRRHKTGQPPRGPGPRPRSPRRYSSRQASISFFSSNGSPTWTDGRFAPLSSSKPAEARTDAPPIPSRPVDAPSRTASVPGGPAVPRTSWSFLITPRHITFTSGLPE